MKQLFTKCGVLLPILIFANLLSHAQQVQVVPYFPSLGENWLTNENYYLQYSVGERGPVVHFSNEGYTLTQGFVQGEITDPDSRNRRREFVIYPIPASNKVYIQLPAIYDNGLEVAITNLAGAELWRGAVTMDQSRSRIELPIVDIAAGIYLITVYTPTEAYTNKRFIVSN